MPRRGGTSLTAARLRRWRVRRQDLDFGLANGGRQIQRNWRSLRLPAENFRARRAGPRAMRRSAASNLLFALCSI